jgi:predicted RNA binding protein YcfA (HicA-like mRNA interferase family)
MGQRKYPPLTTAEVREILTVRNFVQVRQVGSHEQWERQADGVRLRAIVTVDCAISPYGDKLLKSMIRQSGLTRDEFYSATKTCARKCGIPIKEAL